MDKWTIFVIVVLTGVLRGMLQRQHVKAELEARMAKARAGSPGLLKRNAEMSEASENQSLPEITPPPDDESCYG